MEKWTEKEVWNVIAEAGVRGLHAEINQALDAAWEAGYQARAKGEERASEREMEHETGTAG